MLYDLSVPFARDPLVAIAVFVSLAIITTLTRLKARTMKGVPLGIDDYLMMAGLV